MTNHWIDIKNSDAILIMGSNAAEHHPVSFKWIMRAKDAGAAVMHVDPKYSRTSARCDFHVPIRSGTDIAFLGGMINYIIESGSWFKDYVVNYTNATYVLADSYDFNDGLFSGYDAKKRVYDRSSWAFKRDEQGAPVRDFTLKDERCVFNVMARHYSRYTLENVSKITGVSEENLMKVYKIFCATGKPDKAGTILYAIGWTQHTVGVQNIRASAIIQLLLGNIGVAGGGINALRGEPNVQGSLIANGSVVEGTVINSVLFRGVRVAKGAVVRNCVVMQDAQIQEGAEIDHCILDKQAIIRRNGRLIGPEAYPIVIAKDVVI